MMTRAAAVKLIISEVRARSFRVAQHHFNRGHWVLRYYPRDHDDRRDVFRTGNQRSGPIQGATGSLGNATIVSQEQPLDAARITSTLRAVFAVRRALAG
jgi:hypothetical protein